MQGHQLWQPFQAGLLVVCKYPSRSRLECDGEGGGRTFRKAVERENEEKEAE